MLFVCFVAVRQKQRDAILARAAAATSQRARRSHSLSLSLGRTTWRQARWSPRCRRAPSHGTTTPKRRTRTTPCASPVPARLRWGPKADHCLSTGHARRAHPRAGRGAQGDRHPHAGRGGCAGLPLAAIQGARDRELEADEALSSLLLLVLPFLPCWLMLGEYSRRTSPHRAARSPAPCAARPTVSRRTSPAWRAAEQASPMRGCSASSPASRKSRPATGSGTTSSRVGRERQRCGRCAVSQSFAQ